PLAAEGRPGAPARLGGLAGNRLFAGGTTHGLCAAASGLLGVLAAARFAARCRLRRSRALAVGRRRALALPARAARRRRTALLPGRCLVVRVAVVGDVEAAGLADQARAGPQQSADLVLPALGAFPDRRGRDRLNPLKRMIARFALVFVGRHGEPIASCWLPVA